MHGLRACLSYFLFVTGRKAVVIVSRGSITLPRRFHFRSMFGAIGVATVGITSGKKLPVLATNPLYFTRTMFATMIKAVEKVVVDTCAAVDDVNALPIPSEEPPACLVDAVCFVLQGSDSVTKTQFQMQIDYVRKVSKLFTDVQSNVVYSAHVYGDKIVSVTDGSMDVLEMFLGKLDMLQAVPGGGADLTAGVHACYEDLFPLQGEKAIVLISDGHNSGLPFRRGNVELFYLDIGVLSIGIGKDINFKELKTIPTSPQLFIHVGGYRELITVVDFTREEICYQNAATERLDLLPTDPCGIAELKCQLTFVGIRLSIFQRSRLREYPFLQPGDTLNTPTVMNKFLNVPAGDLDTVELSPELIGKKGAKALPKNSFVATRKEGPYSVMMNIQNAEFRKRLKGRCVKVNFSIKRGKGVVTNCAVFKISPA